MNQNAFVDVAFLARSSNRVTILKAVSTEPREPDDLQRVTGVSRVTVKRILDDLLDRGWAVADGHRYEATALGELVAMRFATLLNTLETGARLRDAIQWLPTGLVEFDVDLFSGAVITTADPADPYRPVERLMELIEGAERVRAFGTVPFPPRYMETLYRNLAADLRAEMIYPATVLTALVMSHSEPVTAACEGGALSLWIHNDLPCGLTVCDDRVALSGYDRHTGMLRAVIDTDDPEALVWAEETYTRHRREAWPVDPATLVRATGSSE